MGLVFVNYFGADRVATLYLRHRELTWRSSLTKQLRRASCSRFPAGKRGTEVFETYAPRVSQRRGYNSLASQQWNA